MQERAYRTKENIEDCKLQNYEIIFIDIKFLQLQISKSSTKSLLVLPNNIRQWRKMRKKGKHYKNYNLQAQTDRKKGKLIQDCSLLKKGKKKEGKVLLFLG